VAISTTRGEVTARQLPRTWTTRSEWAETNEEPPNDGPTMTVAIGICRRRRERSAAGWTFEKPSEPSASGIRAPPVSPKYTNGCPSRRAWR
jgi:hypothetical protein